VIEQAEPGFGALLRQLRTEARLTQEELAEAAQLSPRTVSDLERGVNRTAHKDTARLLAAGLGLDDSVRGLFIAAARGRASTTEVLAARLDTPDSLAAVVAEAARIASAPLAVSPQVPRQLPRDVSGFTGREAELAALDRLLREAGSHGAAGAPPITVLSGTAGVGKTALAVRWAHRVAGFFPDGQLYVNLRGYAPEQPVATGEALAGFLRAVGAGREIPLDEAERSAMFRSVTADRRLLIVLDNAASAQQVRPLLPGTESAMVMVTSRDSLAGLVVRDGARRLDLDLLSAADAAVLVGGLIGARAGADPAAVSALAGLCARLPLALRVAAELAASRPGTPLADLAAELAAEEDRLRLLDVGGDEHVAMTSVFSWSYRSLAAPAARMFRLLGLHPGADADRYAAAALAGTDPGAAGQLLSGLARANLLQPAGQHRYGMHDLLRDYAVQLAVSQETEADRREALTRLFDYYLTAAAAAMDALAPARSAHRPGKPDAGGPVPGFPDEAAARDWLDAELATLTAVTAYTVSHGWPGHTILLAATVLSYLFGGHDTEGLTICGHGLNAARITGDRAIEAHALTSIGVFHSHQGRYAEAIGCHEAALALAREVGDRLAQARAFNNLGAIHLSEGRYQLAADNFQQSLALDRELGERVGEALELLGLATILAAQGRLDEATRFVAEAMVLAEETGDRATQASTMLGSADVMCWEGRYREAARPLRRALAIGRELGNRTIVAEALIRLGEVRLRLGDHDRAASCHWRALALFRELGDPTGLADGLNGAGEVLFADGRLDQARVCQAAVLALPSNIDPFARARAHCGLAAACHAAGQSESAHQHWQQAVDGCARLGVPLDLFRARYAAGWLPSDWAALLHPVGVARPGEEGVDDLGRSGRGARIGRGVPAAVEQQRPVRLARAERGDTAHHHVVIPGLVHRLHGALHPGERTGQDRRARRRRRPAHPGELVRPRDAEPPGELLLPGGEHVGAEVPGPGDRRPRGRRPGGAEQHQGRVEGKGGERLAGEPGRAAVLDAGDDGDTGTEVAEHLTEPGRFHVRAWRGRQSCVPTG
jgi:tetratricopeptide (TPR) repeat protein/transcriptional regulator with XRE-family HTH domain